MKRERDLNNCCGKTIRYMYRGEPTWEIKHRAGQEEARLYIHVGHGEYIALPVFGSKLK